MAHKHRPRYDGNPDLPSGEKDKKQRAVANAGRIARYLRLNPELAAITADFSEDRSAPRT